MDERNLNKGFTGAYKVSNFTVGRNTSIPDTACWKKLFVEEWGWGIARLMNEKRVHIRNINFDKNKRSIQMAFWDSARYQKINAVYHAVSPDSLVVKGLWGKDSVQWNMKRYLK
jgi:hypothetical protein